jgi:carbon monoxide dehydrogenase subunit G
VKISGNYTIDAPREQVWDALNNIDVLARVVPGCQRLEQVGENEFEGTVKIGIQTIRGTYNGRIRLEDVQPPHHYKLVANGKSANGIVDGTGAVDLEDQDGKTLLTYSGDANVAGTLASVGQRLIEGAAKQMINQSLKALVEQINKRQAGETGDEAAPKQESAAPAQPSAPAAKPSNGQAERPSVPAASMIGQAAATASSTPRPASSPEQKAAANTTTPAQSSQSFERRAVDVPEHEQLKPETVALGMAQDFYNERPWLPWVVVAFLLGYILGRARS